MTITRSTSWSPITVVDGCGELDVDGKYSAVWGFDNEVDFMVAAVSAGVVKRPALEHVPGVETR